MGEVAGRSGDGEFISVLRGSFFEWIGGWGYRGSLSSPPFFLHDLRGLYASFLAYRILGLFSVLSQCLSIVLLGSEGFFSLWLYLFMYLWVLDLYLFILHIRKHISCFNASCFSASCPLIHSCVRIVTVCGKEFCFPLLFLLALPPYRIWPIPRLPKTTVKSIFLI